MKGQIETYYSYGNCFESKAEVFYPEDVEALKAIVKFCRANDRAVTLARTFNSFDQQNSGNDIVISSKKMNNITYNGDDHTITVGAGAKWGDILDVVYENKCPSTTVSRVHNHRQVERFLSMQIVSGVLEPEKRATIVCPLKF